jgi:TonB family protein
VAVAIDPGMILWVGAGEPTASWPMRMVMAVDHWVPWVLLAWFAGVVVYVVRLNVGLIVAHRLKSRDTHAAAEELQRVFEVLRRRLGIARAVRLMHSARVQVPTVIGWLRPVVLIPASCLTGLSADQIEAIFCHELAHVRRHDYLVSVFQSVVEALLFYHPAVWWVSKQVRRERECCCDEMAVEVGGDVLTYARALSYLEEHRACVPEFVLGANGGVLKMRIKRLLGSKEDVAGSPFAALVVLAVVVAFAGSYFVAVARAQANKPQAALSSGVAAVPTISPAQESASEGSSSGHTLQAIYRGWVSEDVVWIITPEGKAAFLGLTNDEERDAFIANFWERRNPTPGSAVNSFREEHYARIAYANQHFGANVPGWKTDRGRAYTVNGKPISIDAHPSAGQYKAPDGTVTYMPPFEVWHYSSLRGVGQDVDLKFVDDCQCGKYRLISQQAGPVSIPGAGSGPTAIRRAGPVRVSSGVMAGNMENVVNPVYPAEAKAKHVQGVVILHAIISKTGDIENLEVISGPELLRQSAIDAVGRWRYKPYLLNGEPTEVETTINVNYTFSAPQSPSPMSMPAEGSPPAVVGAPGQTIGPVRVSGGVAAGMLILKVDPVYPQDAKDAHVQGAVVLRAIISKTGTIRDLQVVSGPPELTDSAKDAVNQWRYKPYLLNGEPTEVETTITVNYSFDDSAMGRGPSPQGNNSGLAVRKIGGGVSAPLVIHQVPPEYSAEAKAAKFNGIVLVNLIVDEKGMPKNVHVLRGVGNGLDEKAVESVKKYRFRPAREGGKPVPVELNVEVNFQIF